MKPRLPDYQITPALGAPKYRLLAAGISVPSMEISLLLIINKDTGYSISDEEITLLLILKLFIILGLSGPDSYSFLTAIFIQNFHV